MSSVAVASDSLLATKTSQRREYYPGELEMRASGLKVCWVRTWVQLWCLSWGVSQGCTDSGSRCRFICRLFLSTPGPSSGHLMHLKMLQTCKAATHLISHILQSCFMSQDSWSIWQDKPGLRAYDLAHVSHWVLPSPHREPQTTNSEVCCEATGRENRLPLCPNTTHYTPRLSVPSDRHCWIVRKPSDHSSFSQIGLSLICSTVLPPLWPHKKQLTLHRWVFLIQFYIQKTFKFGTYWGKTLQIGPGWGYIPEAGYSTHMTACKPGNPWCSSVAETSAQGSCHGGGACPKLDNSSKTVVWKSIRTSSLIRHYDTHKEWYMNV